MLSIPIKVELNHKEIGKNTELENILKEQQNRTFYK